MIGYGGGIPPTRALCGHRNPGNRGFTCGKEPGHLAADPLHKLDPDDPASMEWLDDAEAPAEDRLRADDERLAGELRARGWTVTQDGLLTTAERAVVQQAGELWNAICAAVPEGPTRDADLRELVLHVHAIQHAFMSNAAARAYPDTYRRLGSSLDDRSQV